MRSEPLVSSGYLRHLQCFVVTQDPESTPDSGSCTCATSVLVSIRQDVDPPAPAKSWGSGHSPHRATRQTYTAHRRRPVGRSTIRLLVNFLRPNLETDQYVITRYHAVTVVRSGLASIQRPPSASQARVRKHQQPLLCAETPVVQRGATEVPRSTAPPSALCGGTRDSDLSFHLGIFSEAAQSATLSSLSPGSSTLATTPTDDEPEHAAATHWT